MERVSGSNTKLYYKVLFCMSETWPLTVRKEHTCRVFDNKVLRRISDLMDGK